MSDEKPQRDQDLEMVQKHARALHEFFDSVQIFCTRYNPNGVEEDDEGSTTRVSHGEGNYYARYGQVAQWVDKERAVTEREE